MQPREWWVYDTGSDIRVRSEPPEYDIERWIRVIEYSAYIEVKYKIDNETVANLKYEISNLRKILKMERKHENSQEWWIYPGTIAGEAEIWTKEEVEKNPDAYIRDGSIRVIAFSIYDEMQTNFKKTSFEATKLAAALKRILVKQPIDLDGKWETNSAQMIASNALHDYEDKFISHEPS